MEQIRIEIMYNKEVNMETKNTLDFEQEQRVSLLGIEVSTKKQFEVSEPYDYMAFLSMFSNGCLPSHDLCVWIWEQVVNSDVLENNPEAIKLTFSGSSEALEKCGSSILALRDDEYGDYDDLFGVPQGFSYRNVVQCCHVDVRTGEINVEFGEGMSRKEVVMKALEDEKNKIARSNKYVEEHPTGFEFLIYEPREVSDPDSLDISSDTFDIITAWSDKEALHKYLVRNKQPRKYNYFKSFFVEDFALSLLYDFNREMFSNQDEVEKISKRLFPELDSDNHDIKEEEIIARITSIISPRELYDILGEEDFEKMWLSYEKSILEVHVSSYQREIIKYLS